MNRVFITGRLVKDPEKFKTDSGSVYARFAVADKKGMRKENDTNNTNFHDCICFGKQAESMCKYTRKGSQVVCYGTLDCRVVSRNGVRQKYWSVSCDLVEFVGEKVQFVDSDGNPETPKGAKEIDTNDEDIPF